MIVAEASCAEWLGTVSDWLTMFGTWSAVVVACVAGYYAKRAFETQDAQLQILREQVADDRAKDHQENQLKRFRHGPFFILHPHSDRRHRQGAPGLLRLVVRDERSCRIAKIIMRVGARNIPELEMDSSADGKPIWFFEFPFELATTEMEQIVVIEFMFATIDGYEDIHTYYYRTNDDRFWRVDPAYMPLHGRDSSG